LLRFCASRVASPALCRFWTLRGSLVLREGAIAATNGVSGGETATVPGADGLDEILIEELELGVRSYNCLKRAGIQTGGERVRKS